MATYTNSSLVSYTKLSPNHSGQRTHAIDRITPHCVVGQCSVETLGNIFYPTSKQASCQYGIGTDGRVGMYVEEKNRSWCTSSSANDQRAITIECASDTTHPYAMNTKVYNKLIELCVDICKRYGKKKLLWFSDKNTNLNYTPASDEMVLTVHRWFANKSCPGDWLFSRLGDVAKAVTAQLGGSTATTPTTPSTEGSSALYRVQTGAFKTQSNATKLAEKLKAAGFDTLIIKSGEYYKVQCGAFSKKDNAEALKKKLIAAGYEAIIVGGETSTPSTSTSTPAATTDNAKTIWDFLKGKGLNEYAVAGIMGNLYAESALNPKNLQNSYEKSLGMTDDTYTSKVDNGSYTNFVKDSAGYGLAQWTYWSRKQALLEFAQAAKKSIGDLGMQLDFLWKELQSYSSVMKTLNSATSIKAASDAVLTGFEKPADQSDSVKTKRAGYGQTYYDKYASGKASTSTPAKEETFKSYLVKVTASVLNVRKEPTTASAVTTQIKDKGVYTIIAESTGTGATKWGKLKSGVGWISLDYTKKV